MNSKQMYLAWVRTTSPKLYWQAVRQVFSPRSGLSGLGDDLTDTISVDPTLSTPGLNLPGATQDTVDAINTAAVTAQTDTSTDWFGQLANAITSIAPTVVQTQAAENLLQINTQRAAQNLPLYTSNGTLVTGSMLSPTSASVAQMEAALANAGNSMLPILLIAGVGILAIAMSGSRRPES